MYLFNLSSSLNTNLPTYKTLTNELRVYSSFSTDSAASLTASEM